MRIQIASDLHLEFIKTRFPGEQIIQPAPHADVLALVGDVSNGLEGVRLFADWPVPVLYVIGNHEAYGHVLDKLRVELRDAARGTSVVIMDNVVADIGRFGDWAASRQHELNAIRFLGCTLWTDYDLPSVNSSRLFTMEHARRRLTDHVAIRGPFGALFSPVEALREHKASFRWLTRELARPFAGKTVVLTHHAPHEGSIHPRYQGNLLNSAFASHLPGLVEQANLWVHGHMHDSCDYRVGNCRVVCNPLGYPLNRDVATSALDLKFENQTFVLSLVVEV